MPLDLGFALDSPLPPGTKGLPLVADGFRVADVGRAGWNLLAGDLPLPAAVLKARALDGNMAAMQAYVASHGAMLAPHGKTSMCPQLFARQLQAGAWGITVATLPQAVVCVRLGVGRILIANQIVGEAEAAMFAALCAREPGIEFLALVDSARGAKVLQDAFEREGATKARVLIELGHAGGRTGLRSVEQGLELARAVAAMSHVRLCGIEGYEGLIVSGDIEKDVAEVDLYLGTLLGFLQAARSENLFADPARILLTAGGSVYFDLVARQFTRGGDPAIEVILRSGCYVTHDSGFYEHHLAAAGRRATLSPPPALENALSVWARVQSVPEEGLAILTAGKRDLSHDINLPRPISWHRPGSPPSPADIQGWKVTKLSDQHCFLHADGEAPTPLAIGDMVELGISHPCTTFDKWPLLLEVNDDYDVIGGLKTFF